MIQTVKNASKSKPEILSTIEELHEFYWLKVELIEFCQKKKLSTQGGKSDLIKRIEVFLSTGRKVNHQAIKKIGTKDSVNLITRNTLVVNYNNDARTRNFFVSQVGERFKFNAYLRQFTDKANIKCNMTYGDLVDGWLLFEEDRKKDNAKNVISSQFEYNQFIKDYFSHEHDGTLKKAISAWKFISSRNGPNTYAQFKFSQLKI